MRLMDLGFAAGIAMFATAAMAQGPYKVLKTAKTGGLGGFDYLYADDAGRRLYIPRGAVQGDNPTPARVTVFNLDTLAKPWPDFASTAAPFARTLGISPTGASVSRLKTVTLAGVGLSPCTAPRGMYKRRPASSA